MTQHFIQGDVVRLVSGGPDMTISAVKPHTFGFYYECMYFHENKLLVLTGLAQPVLISADADEGIDEEEEGDD